MSLEIRSISGIISSSSFIVGLNDELVTKNKIVEIITQQNFNRREIYCVLIFTNGFRLSTAIDYKSFLYNNQPNISGISSFLIEIINLNKNEIDELPKFKINPYTGTPVIDKPRFNIKLEDITMGSTITKINSFDNIHKKLKDQERLNRVEKYKAELSEEKPIQVEISKSRDLLSHRIISYESSLLLNKIHELEPNWDDYSNDEDIINKARQMKYNVL